eukprot:7876888-Pyramimonas_sp.AAC.1
MAGSSLTLGISPSSAGVGRRCPCPSFSRALTGQGQMRSRAPALLQPSLGVALGPAAAAPASPSRARSIE